MRIVFMRSNVFLREIERTAELVRDVLYMSKRYEASICGFNMIPL